MASASKECQWVHLAFVHYHHLYENERYFGLYGVRKEDESNYDFVVDTTHLTPEQVADKIEEEYKKWLLN